MKRRQFASNAAGGQPGSTRALMACAELFDAKELQSKFREPMERAGR
jgi:hypothetical protein